jgi:hypothetical protein
MGCDYYVQTEVVVKFLDTKGNLDTVETQQEIESKYIGYVSDYDSDDDDDTAHKKYEAQLAKRMKESCEKDKVLYENSHWVKDSYQLRYEALLKANFPQIQQFIKVYKTTTAWPRA